MVSYSEVYAFTGRPGHGNRAGVVLMAGALDDSQMQDLASFIDAPETVFVTRLSPGAAQVRYFTPTQEIGFCGHATVALGLRLAQEGHLHPGEPFALDTLAGRVHLRLAEDAGPDVQVWFQTPPLEVRSLPGGLRSELAEALGLDVRALHRGLPLAAAQAGGWSAFVPLLDRLFLEGLEPDLPRIASLCEALGVLSVYAYAPLGVGRFAARDFAPLVGIPEDPVTGSAGGALVGLLAAGGHLPVRGGEVFGVIGQGHELGTPGEIEVRVTVADGGVVQAIHVGGQAVLDREAHWAPV